MLAKVTLAYQRENDPGHQNGVKEREKEKKRERTEKKFKFIHGSSIMLSNRFYVKTINVQVNHFLHIVNPIPSSEI